MYANSLAVDPRDGTIVVAGVAEGTVDFDPGATDLQFPIGDTSAAYVIKLTSSGSLVTNPIRFFAGTGDAYGQSVALDATDSYVYVTGSFQGTDQYVAFGAPTFTSTNGGNDNTPFVLKLDANLNYVWGATSGLDARPAASAVAADGSIYITGEGNSPSDPQNASNAFVEKISSSGSVIGLEEFGNLGGTNTQAEPWSIAIDSVGYVYATGWFSGDMTFGNGSTVQLSGPNGAEDTTVHAFLVKFDPSLKVVWARALESSSTDQALAVAIDGSNNVDIAGTVGGPATFGTTATPGTLIPNSGTSSIAPAFLLKVDPEGNLLDWAVGTASSSLYIAAIATSPTGTIEIAGDLASPATFGSSTLQPSGGATTGVFLVAVTESSNSHSSGPSAPVFLSENRTVIRVGKHRKKATLYQLNFSGPLNTSEVLNPGLFQVTQSKKHGKHKIIAKHVRVLSEFSSPGSDSVSLLLGKTVKKKPLKVTASGLAGANGTTIATFSTSL